MILSALSHRQLTPSELRSLTLGQLKALRAVLIARGGEQASGLTHVEQINLESIKVQEVYTRHAERILKRMVNSTSMEQQPRVTRLRA